MTQYSSPPSSCASAMFNKVLQTCARESRGIITTGRSIHHKHYNIQVYLASNILYCFYTELLRQYISIGFFFCYSPVDDHLLYILAPYYNRQQPGCTVCHLCMSGPGIHRLGSDHSHFVLLWLQSLTSDKKRSEYYLQIT